MPSIQQLLNYQKGRMLADLFPDEIPGFMKFLFTCGQKISTDPKVFKTLVLPFTEQAIQAWLLPARAINDAIELLGDKLKTNHILFGYEIFDHFRGSYTIHCLRSYSKFLQPDNKFRRMIDILFE